MSLSARDVLEVAIRPALRALGPRFATTDAERLVLGTAAVETGFSKLRQYNGGPAVGLWQMEPVTYRDHWRQGGLVDAHGLRTALLSLSSTRSAVPFHAVEMPDPGELAWNLRFAAAMCRVHYLREHDDLPSFLNVAGQAAYWKKVYNTPLGAGQADEYVRAYDRLITPLGLDGRR